LLKKRISSKKQNAKVEAPPTPSFSVTLNNFLALANFILCCSLCFQCYL